MREPHPSPIPLALLAEPPAAGEAGYFPLLHRANPEILPARAVFLFHPGMLFGSRERWWGNPAPRPTPHEGLDLWLWEDDAGQPSTLPVTFRVPAPLPGRVARLLPDFLGLTVCLRHERGQGEACLYSLLGHLRPRDDLREGSRVAAGDLLGTLAAPHKPTRVPPHLHLTLACLPPAQEGELLDWGVLGRHPAVRLVDPLPWLRLPHRLTGELPLESRGMP
jgi:hypothetical protein